MTPTPLLLCPLVFALGDDPFADVLVDYDPGLNPAPGYTDASSTLGSPERFTGEGVFPGVVSPFNSPFGADEIVSIGVDGWLVVSFDTPVTDDPANPFGIDLLIFGNSFFFDAAYPSGIVGGNPLPDGGIIEVSADCETFFVVPDVLADGLFPTLGFQDAGPYDEVPGGVPTNFTRPVDPALLTADFVGADVHDLVTAYAGSGGGAGVDLASVGLASITCVRITNPGDPQLDPNVEIDAFADVTPDAGPADINRDGVVDTTDFLLLLGSWGKCPPGPCVADVNDDGFVDTIDMLELLASWTT